MYNFEEIKKRYLKMQESDGVDNIVISEIEKILNVNLPKEFCEIVSYFSGGYFGGISNYSFASNDESTNIIQETIRLRNTINLPLRFIVLAEPAESLIVMDTQNLPSIIWCDAVEVSKLNDKSFISKPDEWNSYADFFTYLVEEEEEEQQ